MGGVVVLGNKKKCKSTRAGLIIYLSCMEVPYKIHRISSKAIPSEAQNVKRKSSPLKSKYIFYICEPHQNKYTLNI